MTPDTYPSVTIVAGPIAPARPSDIYGALLRMHDGQIYITMTADVAAQWLPILTEIAEEKQ